MVFTSLTLFALLLADLNARNKSLTAKRLQQGYRYHKLRKAFSILYPFDTLNWFLNKNRIKVTFVRKFICDIVL